MIKQKPSGLSGLDEKPKRTEVKYLSKNSFILYHDYKRHFSMLTDEQLGKLTRAIFDYEIDGTEPDLEAVCMMAFSFVKNDLDLNKEKYNRIIERNISNGGKGGRPKEQEPKKPSGLSGLDEKPKHNPRKPKKPDNVNDNVNDSDNDIKKTKEWASFVTMRKSIKKPLSERAHKMALNKLEEIAPGDIEAQKLLLDQSTFHCWQDIYPLKQGKPASRSNRADNPFAEDSL